MLARVGELVTEIKNNPPPLPVDEIAETLHLAEKTVESHRANLLRKLGMRDRVELVRYAIRRGLIEA